MKNAYFGILALAAAAMSLQAGNGTSVSANRGLPERMARIVDGTYTSLANRIRPSGYAGTSVTGAYPGMFARDASIQAMVMQKAGDAEAARKMLEYLINYSTVAGLKRAYRYAPDEEYVTAASIPSRPGDADVPEASFQDAAMALFKVNGTNNGAAQTFMGPAAPVTRVSLSLLALSNTVGKVTVTIRRSHDWDAPVLGTATANSNQAYSAEGKPAWVDFAFPSPVLLAAGQQYDILVQAGASPTVQAWGNENASTSKQRAFNYDAGAQGGWSETNSQIGFRVFTAQGAALASSSGNGPGFLPAPAVRLASAGGGDLVKQAFAANAVVSGVDLFLGAGAGASGAVKVSVSDSTGRTSTATTPASELPEEGKWVRFTFPTVGIGGNGSYTVTVQAPESAAGSVSVYGVPKAEAGPAVRTVQVKGGASSNLEGALVLQALSLVYSGEDVADQPDGNYMVILAWARYVEAHPEDTQFVKDTYATIAAWADYYLNDNYFNDSLDLLFNPRFEHSRRSWFIPTYDLITNVFAAQALRELAAIAGTLKGQSSRAAQWSRWSERLEEGINKNLTSKVDGKPIYAELYWSDGGKDGNLARYDGYSWVSLAPVAAHWEGIDWGIMANTYDAYLKYGSIEWTNTRDGRADRMLMTDTEENTWDPPGNGVDQWNRYAVIVKGLGWEYSLAGRLKRANRLAAMSHFVEVQTPEDVIGESYYKQGPSDVGNQEQSAWWLLGVMDAYPARSEK